MLSCAFRKLLAPGIGTVPCAMHQLMATCKGGHTQFHICRQGRGISCIHENPTTDLQHAASTPACSSM